MFNEKKLVYENLETQTNSEKVGDSGATPSLEGTNDRIKDANATLQKLEQGQLSELEKKTGLKVEDYPQKNDANQVSLFTDSDGKGVFSVARDGTGPSLKYTFIKFSDDGTVEDILRDTDSPTLAGLISTHLDKVWEPILENSDQTQLSKLENKTGLKVKDFPQEDDANQVSIFTDSDGKGVFSVARDGTGPSSSYTFIKFSENGTVETILRNTDSPTLDVLVSNHLDKVWEPTLHAQR